MNQQHPRTHQFGWMDGWMDDDWMDWFRFSCCSASTSQQELCLCDRKAFFFVQKMSECSWLACPLSFLLLFLSRILFPMSIKSSIPIAHKLLQLIAEKLVWWTTLKNQTHHHWVTFFRWIANSHWQSKMHNNPSATPPPPQPHLKLVCMLQLN